MNPVQLYTIQINSNDFDEDDEEELTNEAWTGIIAVCGILLLILLILYIFTDNSK